MKGIIIAGGLGTRLRPLTYSRPKPLVPVANRPFLEYQVALLRKHGIDDIVLATNYMADQIEAHFGDGSQFGVRMRMALEEIPLGTGGAIRNAASFFEGESVVVFNGDVLTDFDLGAIIKFHRARKSIATITLTPIPRPHPFGIITTDGDGRVSGWHEPTEAEKKAVASGKGPVQTGSDQINAGFYILEPECLDRIPLGSPSSIERDIFPLLLNEKAAVFAVAPGGYWMDVGRPEQLLVATRAAATGAVGTDIPVNCVGTGTKVAVTATLDPTTVIGSNCSIGENSVLTGCIILNDVKIGSGVRLNHVVVGDAAIIEDDVVVNAHPDGPTPVVAAGSTICRGSKF